MAGPNTETRKLMAKVLAYVKAHPGRNTPMIASAVGENPRKVAKAVNRLYEAKAAFWSKGVYAVDTNQKPA